MTDRVQDDGYALGLLVDLRDICTRIGESHYRMAAELHALLRKVANPNVHDLDKELTFRVEQTAHGERGETLRTILLNGNADVARAAFDAAVSPRHRSIASSCELPAEIDSMAIKNAALHQLFRLPAHLYSVGAGWVLGRRFLMLTSVGRRSGLLRNTVLECMEDRGDEFIVMAGFGRQSDWLRNIQAHPDQVTVTVGTKRFRATFRFIELNEAVTVFAAYEQRAGLLRGIVRVTLSRLLGWPYDGSDEARQRAVTQLPLIAFRART